MCHSPFATVAQCIMNRILSYMNFSTSLVHLGKKEVVRCGCKSLIASLLFKHGVHKVVKAPCGCAIAFLFAFVEMRLRLKLHLASGCQCCAPLRDRANHCL